MRSRKPPNAPAALCSLPTTTSKRRSTGRSSGGSESSTVTDIGSASRSAAASAADSPPRMRQRPSETTSTVRAGGAASSAWATSAACLGPASAASSDHPARSRISTSIGAGTSSSSAISSNRAHSCWQAIVASPAWIALAAAPASVVQSALWMREQAIPAPASMLSASIFWLCAQSHSSKVPAMPSSSAKAAAGWLQPCRCPAVPGPTDVTSRRPGGGSGCLPPPRTGLIWTVGAPCPERRNCRARRQAAGR